MKQVKEGDLVKVHYTGKLVNGEQFDSSIGREPLEFTVGAGQMIKGFDNAMPGMSLGEKKTINIAPEDGYGVRLPLSKVAIPKTNTPNEADIELGKQMVLYSQDGQEIPATIVEITDADIIFEIDENHFLAGEELIFDIELVEISE